MSTIRILQHNCARSSNVMYSLLNTAERDVDIIITQEPWLSRDGNTISHASFHTYIAKHDENERARTIKNHTKTKKTPATVWNAQNLHTLDSHIILKLSVSTIKLSTLRRENPAYAALSEQEDSDKRNTVPPYKKFFIKFSLRLLASLGAKLTCYLF